MPWQQGRPSYKKVGKTRTTSPRFPAKQDKQILAQANTYLSAKGLR